LLTPGELWVKLPIFRDIASSGLDARWFARHKINLHVAGAELEPHAEVPTPGSGDLCLLISGPIDEVQRDLAQAGIPVELGPVDRAGAEQQLRSLYVRDPDGNLVELAQPLAP
jgi:catechol 2,3-dioxygenase-like lactoylglutathione lyase family enzyme